LARGPALRALVVEDLPLERVGFGRVPEAREIVVDVAQAADLPVVDRAGEDVAPRVDEAGCAERVAPHRRLPGLEVLADVSQIGPLEVADRAARDAAEVRVLLDRRGELLAARVRPEAEVGVAEVVRRLVHDVYVELVVPEIRDLALRGGERDGVVVDV